MSADPPSEPPPPGQAPGDGHDVAATKGKVSRGIAWVGVASAMVGVLDFVAIFIILAYWIPAEQYGIATKAVWMFPLLDLLADLGMSAAVIREKLERPVVSTIFWLNLITAVVLFGLLLVFAPILALGFYGHVVVGQMLIAYGFKLLWRHVYFIPLANLKRELRFKEISIARILGNLAEFGVKLATAAMGFGVWCFVTGGLARVLVFGLVAQWYYPWRPSFSFQPRLVWRHLKFGLQTAGSALLAQLFGNIDYPVVGYFFGDKVLGMYKLAHEIIFEPVKMIAGVVVDVAFSAFARVRDSRPQLVDQFLSFTTLNLITVNTYIGIVFVAADDIVGLFDASFAGAGAAVRLLCAVAILRSLGYVMPPLLDGTGRAGQTLTYMVTASIIMPVLFVLFAAGLPQLGLLAVPLAWIVGYPLAFAVLLGMSLRALELPLGTYLREQRLVWVCTLAPVLVSFAVHLLYPWQSPVTRILLVSAIAIMLTMFLLHRLLNLSFVTAWRALQA
ncbi:MAG: oligosaccharide flippase family protein [Myxococcales bacterium]|nr:oligosaccharide flippase family protein [Myxococcales bacterium]